MRKIKFKQRIVGVNKQLTAIVFSFIWIKFEWSKLTALQCG